MSSNSSGGYQRGSVTEIESVEHFRNIVYRNPEKLIVCDFFATWYVLNCYRRR